jgi:hypothetical protein
MENKIIFRPWFYFAIIVVLFVACQSSFDSEEELKEYVRETSNGLKKEKSIGQIELDVTYKPTDLLVAQELSGKVKNVDTLRKKYQRFDYFTLSVSANNKEIESYNLQASFGERVQDLAFGMGNHVYLISEQQDTIPMVDYVYQRTYGMSNSSDFMFVFDAKDIDDTKNLTFQLNDFGLGVGTNRFKFKTENLRQIPKINF